MPSPLVPGQEEKREAGMKGPAGCLRSMSSKSAPAKLYIVTESLGVWHDECNQAPGAGFHGKVLDSLSLNVLVHDVA